MSSRKRTLLIWWIVGIAFMIGMDVFFERFGRKHGWSETVFLSLMAVSAGVVFIPMWVWQARHRLPIIVVQKGSRMQQLASVNFITLEFRDERYARDFVLLNRLSG